MFPTVVDNTIRKDFVTCPTLAMYKHVRQIRPIVEKQVDLHFGKCFATGTEAARRSFFEQHNGADAAVEDGVAAACAEWGNFEETGKSHKTLGRLPTSLRYYFQQWPLGFDGLTATIGGIERSFKIELPIAHPDRDEPLFYAGRYDMKATDLNGRIHIVDEKTANRLGDTWFEQWDLDSQMTGYLWSVQEEFLENGGNLEDMPEMLAIIRGLSILKDSNGHAEVIVTRPHWMLNRWYNQLLRDVWRMVDSYKSGEWDVALSTNSCACYNRPCSYAKLCLTPDPEQRIQSEYHTVVWNPLL